mmetsp:Transcript_42941/g.114917  ORF Transcript_42941/g.114917 Transcript_42941/m.114917 type:complete len:164 (+) Transcript_42941:767-1258(+)
MQDYLAGHMVPMDQPAVAQAMLNDFVAGKMGAQEEEAQFGCSGSADLSGSGPWCYQGKKGAFCIEETLNVKVESCASGAGTMDFVGSGYKALTCSGRAFTKKGQEISPDFSKCSLPSGVRVEDLKYCSDADSVQLTFKDVAVPIPFTATMTKVACSGESDIIV